MVSWLWFADVHFGGDKQRPEKCLRSQANDVIDDGRFSAKLEQEFEEKKKYIAY